MQLIHKFGNFAGRKVLLSFYMYLKLNTIWLINYAAKYARMLSIGIQRMETSHTHTHTHTRANSKSASMLRFMHAYARTHADDVSGDLSEIPE